MTKTEIGLFIEIMEDVGCSYTPEEVEQVYGHLSLEEAIDKRLTDGMRVFYDFVEEVVIKDLEDMGRTGDAASIKKYLGK